MTKIMEQNNFIKLPRIGEIIEGKVVGKGKASIFLDLGNIGAGIIYGREFYEAKFELKNLKIGDNVFAKIIDLENEDGYIELSLTKASQELAWETLKEKKEKDEVFNVKILGANKGGLLTKVSGVPSFLPASQLSSANYPKVEDNDNQKILKSLQKLIGKELEVKIFDLNPKEGKLILSEKAKEGKRIKEILKNYKVNDIVEGEITGVVDFGAFVKIPVEKKSYLKNINIPEEHIPDNLEGLIHISELDWKLIEDPAEIVKVGQKIKAKIIDISNDKISLSLKTLQKDPWQDIEKKYKKGDIVRGKVKKFNPFGVFVQLLSSSDSDDENENKIQGLCHVSEFGSQKKMEKIFKIGGKYDFQILSIEPNNHRMSLKLIEK